VDPRFGWWVLRRSVCVLIIQANWKTGRRGTWRGQVRAPESILSDPVLLPGAPDPLTQIYAAFMKGRMGWPARGIDHTEDFDRFIWESRKEQSKGTGPASILAPLNGLRFVRISFASFQWENANSILGAKTIFSNWSKVEIDEFLAVLEHRAAAIFSCQAGWFPPTEEIWTEANPGRLFLHSPGSAPLEHWFWIL